MDSAEVITQIKSELGVLRRYGVERIGVFGSYATGKPNAESDIDILVHFAEDAKSFDNFMDVKSRLEAIFPGHRVDLVLEDALKPGLRDNVLRETLYVA